MMREIITVRLAGPMPEEREKIFILTRKKRRSLHPAQVRLFTERRFLIRSDTLMKNILHISKIWM